MQKVAPVLMAIVTSVLVVAAPDVYADDHHDQLADGEIFVSTVAIEGAYYPKVRVEGVIDATPDIVWKAVSDCVGSHKVHSSVSESHVVKRIGDDVVCSELIDLPWPIRNLLSITRWKFAPGPPIWEHTWTLIEGDFDYTNGRWKLTPFGAGRTLALYENHFSPHMSVPDWLTRAFLKVGMPGVIKDVRKASRRMSKN